MLPHVIRFNGAEFGRWYRDLLEGTGAANGFPAPGRGCRGSGRVRRRIGRPGRPVAQRLAECGVERERLRELAAGGAKQWTGGFNPRTVDRSGPVGVVRGRVLSQKRTSRPTDGDDRTALLRPRFAVALSAGCANRRQHLRPTCRSRKRRPRKPPPASRPRSPPPRDQQSAAADNGQWPVFRGDALANGVAAERAAREARSCCGNKSFKDGMFEATPAIVDGVVYVGGLDGTSTRSTWRPATKSGSITPSWAFARRPRCATGCVFVGDTDGKFYCLDAATGETMWELVEPMPKSTPARISTRTTCCSARRMPRSIALDAKTGGKAWKYAIDNQIRCSPTVVEDRVLPGRLRRQAAHHRPRQRANASRQVDIRRPDRRDARP